MQMICNYDFVMCYMHYAADEGYVDIQMISLWLAVVVGALCFWLVKHTADEFDRWYEGKGAVISLRIPAALGMIVVAAIVGWVLFAH